MSCAEISTVSRPSTLTRVRNVSYNLIMTRLLIALTLCLAVLLSCATGASAANEAANGRKLRAAALSYHKAQVDNRWRDACKMLSRHALANQGGLSGCIANFSTNGFAPGTMTIRFVTVKPSGYRGSVYTYLNGNRQQRWTLNFVRENGVYKLDSDRS